MGGHGTGAHGRRHWRSPSRPRVPPAARGGQDLLLSGSTDGAATGGQVVSMVTLRRPPRRPKRRSSRHRLVRVSAPPLLPVLDISEFRADPAGPGGVAFVAALRDAFHGIGAAYLVGHGVADGLVARVR